MKRAILALALWAAAAGAAAARDIRYAELTCNELTAEAESGQLLTEQLGEADFAAHVLLARGPAYNQIAQALCGVPDPACVQNTQTGAGAAPTLWANVRGLKGSPGRSVTLTPANYEAPRLGVVQHADGWMNGAACIRGFRSLETDALAVDGFAPFVMIVSRSGEVALWWSRDAARLSALRR